MRNVGSSLEAKSTLNDTLKKWRVKQSRLESTSEQKVRYMTFIQKVGKWKLEKEASSYIKIIKF